MNTSHHSQHTDRSLERFETWLQTTGSGEAPDVTQRVLQQLQSTTTRRATPRFSHWNWPIAAAASVVLALGLSLLFLSPRTSEEQRTAHLQTTELIVDDLLLERPSVESIVWLLEEDNLFVLTSYFPLSQ